MPLKPPEVLVLRALAHGDKPEHIASKHAWSGSAIVNNLAEDIRIYYGARTTAQAIAIACTRGDLKGRKLGGQPKLTGREQEILNSLADGERSNVLAHRYGLDKNGIDWQIRRLVRKLKAKNRENAIFRAWCYGLLYAVPAKEPTKAPIKKPARSELTDAQLLMAIIGSANYKEAARKLSIPSTRTLETRINLLCSKLGAKTRPQAVAIALKRRMIVYPPLVGYTVDLEDRELVACRGTANGLSQRQIAKELGLKKEDQVTTIMTSAKTKLGARHLEHAVVRCHQLGLL